MARRHRLPSRAQASEPFCKNSGPTPRSAAWRAFRDLRCRLRGCHARPAGHGADQKATGIRQAGRRVSRRHGLERPDRERPPEPRRTRKRSGERRANLRRRSGRARCDLGDRDLLRPLLRSLGCHPLARHFGACALPRSVFSQRTPCRACDFAGPAHCARENDRLLGRRDGPYPVHAVELCRLCR